MSTNHSVESQPDNKNGHKREPAILPEQASAPTGMFERSDGLPGSNSNGNIEVQATQLNDPSLHTAQRQMIAKQIGHRQGNQHLQQIMGRRAATRRGTVKSVNNTSISRQPVQPPGTKVQLPTVAPAPGDEKPAWLDPANHEPLPGVQALDYPGPYTEADREKMRQALNRREGENRRNIGRFLNDFVTACVEISAGYAMEEMSAAAKDVSAGLFSRLMKYALGEAVEALAEGGVGIFAAKLGKHALHALKFMGEKGAGIAASEVLSANDDQLLSEALDEREAALKTMVSKFAASTGKFVEEMINAMDGEAPNRAYWLRGAGLGELTRFRIAEPFPPARKEAIRAVIAGILASHVHTGQPRTGYKPSIGLQHGMGAGDTFHRHEAIIHLDPGKGTSRTAAVRQAQLNSSSTVLSHELTGASIRLLPRMALFITVDPPFSWDGIEALLNARGYAGGTEISEIMEFQQAYDQKEHPSQPTDWGTFDPSLQRNTAVYGKMIIKRLPDGSVTIESPGIGGDLWLYRWATGDDSLRSLASQLITWQEEIEQRQNATETRIVSPAAMGKLARQRIASNWRLEGAQKLISQFVGNLVLQAPTGERAKGIAIDPRDRSAERP